MEEEKKQGSNVALIVILVVAGLLILAAIAGGVWYYLKQKKQISDLEAQVKSASSSTSTTTTSTSVTSSSATSGSLSKTGTMPSNSYVISDSDSRVLVKADIINLTPWQLKVARNEIYARHGRPFVHKDLQCYFAKQSWYSSNPNFNENVLSVLEKKNSELIKSYEIEINSPFFQKDSGC